jgi:glycosyltransferase involved in cell wall biosynthesis
VTTGFRIIDRDYAEPAVATLADSRWRGKHGIGRFATEVLSRIGAYRSVRDSIPLLHPLEPAWLAATVRLERPAVYFTPGFNPPPYSPCPTVFVIHDLIHLRTGEASFAKRLYYEAVVRPAARRAAAVLTVSESSKNEILEWARVPPSKVVVVGNGASSAFTSCGPKAATPQPYFLYVGNFKPHKNVPRILEAFSRSGLANDFRLVMAGLPDVKTVAKIRNLKLSHRVSCAGSPSDSDLAAFYRGATALVTPSLAEGFGLPALEAMACGCPVVAAHRGAQREVLGEAGILVNPESIEDIAGGMYRATDLECRTRAVSTGYQRASRFSWDATAARVREILHSAAHCGGFYHDPREEMSWERAR